MDISLSITGLLALISKLFKSLWQLIRPTDTQQGGVLAPIPDRTIIIAPAGPNYAWWQVGQQMGPKGQKPVMLLDAHFTVTNISTYNVRLVTAELKIGTIWPKRILTHVMTQPQGGGAFGNNMIQSGSITEIMAIWHVEPPVWKSGMSKTADVAVCDNFGNPHWLKGVKFEYW